MRTKKAKPHEKLSLHCHKHNCAKRNIHNNTCHVISDPYHWWNDGICTALTTDPEWHSKTANAAKVYIAGIIEKTLKQVQ